MNVTMRLGMREAKMVLMALDLALERKDAERGVFKGDHDNYLAARNARRKLELAIERQFPGEEKRGSKPGRRGRHR